MNTTVTIHTPGGAATVSASSGSLLSEALGLSGHPVDLPCGGRGVCGNCRVVARGQLSAPGPVEIRLLGEQLTAGVRLACMTRLLGPATVWTDAAEGFDTAVTAGTGETAHHAPLYRGCGAAVDIGTTTLAARLYRDGRPLAEATAKNPQTAFGADVISRIGQSLAGKGEALAQSVRGGVGQLLHTLCTKAGVPMDSLDGLVITGNTAMLYLLTGRSPASLAAAPFAADCLFNETLCARELGLPLPGDAQIYLPRCMGAFVGGDITTAVLASGMTAGTETALLVDIGTNGEMALWHQGVLTCCSTAAGPAFEGAGITQGMHGVAGAIDHVTVAGEALVCTVIGGGEAKGLCGSAVVDGVAAMLAVGALDETGRIEPEDCRCPGRISQQEGDLFFRLQDNVGLCGKDVRAVQLAKSAICAGLETLLHTAGLAPRQVDTLYIAGGFGSYLNLDNAAAIGLIPASLRGCAQVIGNAALTGAAMMLGDRELLAAASAAAAQAHVLDLGSSPIFMERYMENMGF